jgi:hypothetical protein
MKTMCEYYGHVWVWNWSTADLNNPAIRTQPYCMNCGTVKS